MNKYNILNVPLQVRMSHPTGEEGARARRAISWFTIPKVKNQEEAEARERAMAKAYLPKEVQKRRTQTERLAEKKGVSVGVLINGSKQKGIKRMSEREVKARKPHGYTEKGGAKN